MGCSLAAATAAKGIGGLVEMVSGSILNVSKLGRELFVIKRELSNRKKRNCHVAGKVQVFMKTGVDKEVAGENDVHARD